MHVVLIPAHKAARHAIAKRVVLTLGTEVCGHHLKAFDKLAGRIIQLEVLELAEVAYLAQLHWRVSLQGQIRNQLKMEAKNEQSTTRIQRRFGEAIVRKDRR